jgi:predicted transposase YdaD
MRQGDLRQHGPTITSFINKGVEKGREEGRHMGREEGSLDTLRTSVRAVLSARQIVLSDLQARSVAECADAQRLSQWLGRAATASSAADVFVTE